MSAAAKQQPSKTVLVPVKDIQVSMLPPQVERRKHFKQEKLQELSDSIKTQGLIQPIVVRPLKKGRKPYELIAGERRYLATQLAKLSSIETIVRDLDDEQTVEVQLQENLQRMEVEPLDEAFSYKWLLDHATVTEKGQPRPFTVADIAAKFGRPESIILRRMQLNTLVPKAVKDLAEGLLPLAHAELMARFPESEQEEMLKGQNGVYRYGRREDGAVPYKQFREQVDRNHLRLLHGAPFDAKDGSLHPQGLACGDCKERTGYSPQLFDDGFAKKDACLNGKCFKAKTVAFIKIQRVKIASDYPNPKNVDIKKLAEKVPLLKSYWHTNIGPGNYVDETWDMKKPGSLSECPSVEKAISVKNENLGRVVLICRNKKCKKHYSSRSSGGDDSYALKNKEQRVNRDAEENARKVIIPAYIANFGADALESVELRRRILATRLANGSYSFCENLKGGVADAIGFPKDLQKVLDGYSADKEEKVFAILQKLSPEVEGKVMAAAVYLTLGHQGGYSSVDQAPVKAIAEGLGIDYDVEVAEARVKAAPNAELKQAAIDHVEALKAGKKSTAPNYFWPKPKKAAVAKAPKAKAKAKTAKAPKAKAAAAGADVQEMADEIAAILDDKEPFEGGDGIAVGSSGDE